MREGRYIASEHNTVLFINLLLLCTRTTKQITQKLAVVFLHVIQPLAEADSSPVGLPDTQMIMDKNWDQHVIVRSDVWLKILCMWPDNLDMH